jgi:hypothetical protein
MNAADLTRREMAAERGLPFPPPGQMEAYKAAAQYAYDDYLRRVGGERDAGLDNTVRWLGSEYTRDLGLRALAHISNQAAEARLLEAAKSKGPQLAQAAEGFLQMRGELRARGLLK